MASLSLLVLILGEHGSPRVGNVRACVIGSLGSLSSWKFRFINK